jgi:hypothetical protein
MGMIKSFKNSDWYKDRYGENAGVERLVELLKKNNGHYIFSYSRHDRQLIEVRGTGNLLRGKGRNREYDIETRRFEIGHRQGKPVTDWVPLNKVDSSDLWIDLTANDYGYINGLAIEATFNEVDDVMDSIRAIVARLKPHQSYTFGNLKLTHQMYADAYSINCTVEDDTVYPVPVTLLKSKYLVSPEVIRKPFNKDMVGVASEAKINRHHRSIHDLKRWYTCKQVPSSTDRHNIRFTHRRSAGADVRYYQLDFLLDSTLIIGYPFYASQIFQGAVRELEKTYPDSDWQLELDIAETMIYTLNDEKIMLLTYSNRQASSKGHVDKFPVLIQDTPVVRNYVTYGGNPGWDIVAAKKNEQED